MNYQPNYYQPNLIHPPYMAQQNTDERIWVQSEAAAEAYLVAPGGSVRLWDSTKPVFYEKTADASGRLYPIRKYEYKEVQNVVSETTNYKNEIDALIARVEALEGKVNDSKSITEDTAV